MCEFKVIYIYIYTLKCLHNCACFFLQYNLMFFYNHVIGGNIV